VSVGLYRQKLMHAKRKNDIFAVTCDETGEMMTNSDVSWVKFTFKIEKDRSHNMERDT